MSLVQIPENYLKLATSQVKNPSVVVSIPGLDLLTNRTVFRKLKYGDAGLTYGQPYMGITNPVYGQLLPISGFQSLLVLEKSSLSISQKLEPEQGRSSVSILTLAFLDKDSYMTKVISPGVLIPEILGAPITVYLGWEEVSYPEDYFTIFRGRVSGVETTPGIVTLQISDPNFGRRTQVFFSAKTTLASSVLSTDTTIPVVNNSSFHKPITQPSGSGTDSAVTTYLKIGGEYITYTQSGFGVNTFTSVARGQRGTAAVSHTSGDDVQAVIQLQDQPIDMALKLMLSGWNGHWLSGVAIRSFVQTNDAVLGSQPNTITLLEGVDAIRDYGLAVGDFLNITGATNASNNGYFRITDFSDGNGTFNNIIYTSASSMVSETTTIAAFAIRSQFDSYPVTCGTKLTPLDVDIAGHTFVRSNFVSSASFGFLLESPDNAKTFIESELYLPSSLYSLTRNGRLSVGVTKPPLATQSLVFLTKDNVLSPETIKTQRATNNRKFWNEVDYYYDLSDDGSTFNTTFVNIDADSQSDNSLGGVGIVQNLTIKSKGAKTLLGANFLDRSIFFLSRYKRGALIVDLKVNWGVGSQIEAGDVVALQDNGNLQIPNPATGIRNLGTQLFEVTERTLDIKTGVVSLKLIGNLGAELTDRYGVISPSSLVRSGATSSNITIQDSFGSVTGLGKEDQKWKPFIGLTILVHKPDWSQSSTSTLTGIIAGASTLQVSPALSFTPVAGDVVEIDNYPTSSDSTLEQAYKNIFTFLSPTVPVVSGGSNTTFTVSAGDISKFFVGAVIIVHNSSFSLTSGEVTVLTVDTITNTITTKTTMGFTPDNTYVVDGIGFEDQSSYYRFI